MSTFTERDQIVAELRQAEKLLLTTHENPDGDALGSLLGMHQILTQLGQLHATAALAADTRGRHRRIERPVQSVDQQPRTAIAHVELMRRPAQRAALLNPLQQGDLARPDRAGRAHIQTKANGDHRALQPACSGGPIRAPHARIAARLHRDKTLTLPR